MNYVTSKDYERLIALLKEGKTIIGFTGNGSIKSSKIAKHHNDKFWFSNEIEFDEIEFKHECWAYNFEFLQPTAWIKIESDKDLPPKGDYCVLVYRPKDNDYEVVHVNYFYSPYAAPKKFFQVTGVTHYKPLPEAPKE